ELVDAGVSLDADLLARFEAHDHQLGVIGGEQHVAKVLVAQGQLLDRSHESDHRRLLFEIVRSRRERRRHPAPSTSSRIARVSWSRPKGLDRNARAGPTSRSHWTASSL